MITRQTIPVGEGGARLDAAVLAAFPTSTRAFVREGKENGLIAMETVYPTFTAEQTALAKEIAAEHGLLESGGSDFHGTNKQNIFLGVGRNNISVPLEFAIKLEKAR